MPDTSVDYSRETALAIGNMPVSAGTLRGLTGDLQPIDNGPTIEMLDYSMDDQTVPSGQLYEVTLTSTDLNAPPLFGTFKGFILRNVDFPREVSESLALFPAGPTRTPVPGSVYYMDLDESVEVEASDPRAATRFYRPRFARLMITEPWKLGFDEYEQTWNMSLKGRELPPEEAA